MVEKVGIALWSYHGAGVQYGGPGRNAWRLYSHMGPAQGYVDLFHASDEQRNTDVFRRQVKVSDRGTEGALDQVLTIRGACKAIGSASADLDVVHSLTGYYLGLIPALWAAHCGLPAAVKITSSGSETRVLAHGLRSLPQRTRMGLLRRSTGFIAISSEIADDLKRVGVPPNRIHRIPNGVDTKLFRPGNTAHDRPLRVLFVGGITRRKRPHLLLEAFSRLTASRDDLELWIAGPDTDPGYRRELNELAEDLSIAERLSWLGDVKAIEEVYRQCDVLCLPSHTEGMANCILEAMSSGLPFVSTPTSGMSELADSGAGLVCDDNAASIARALEDAIETSQQRGRVGREVAESTYGFPIILERHLEVFRSLLAG